MGFGISTVLIAVGAVLAFAVNASSNVVNVHTVGWIVMAAGVLGLLLSLALWSDWAHGPRRRRIYDEDEVL